MPRDFRIPVTNTLKTTTNEKLQPDFQPVRSATGRLAHVSVIDGIPKIQNLTFVEKVKWLSGNGECEFSTISNKWKN